MNGTLIDLCRSGMKLCLAVAIFNSLSGVIYANELCENLFDKRCSILESCSSSEITDRIFFGFLRKTPEQKQQEAAAKVNLETLRKLDSLPIQTPSEGRVSSLTSEQVSTLYRSVSQHPVASLANYSKYDPENRGIGFCFGRAMTVHLEALWNLKLEQSSIRKLFAVGELSSGDTKWRYHVTTIVRTPDGDWMAIDPIMGRPMPAAEWVETMKKKFDAQETMMVFDTPAKRFGPSTDSPAYRKEDLEHRAYNSYFVDLLAAYKATR